MMNKKQLLEYYRTHPDSSARLEGLFPEMMKAIGKLILFLSESPLRRSIPLVLWSEFWLERVQVAENHTRYKRGRIVYADLGAFNIGSETSYRHPCLILYEGRNWAFIAPMTSKKYGDPITLHYDLPLHYPFDTPSTLQLDAVKVIDKRRILGYFFSKSQHDGSLTPEELDKLEPIVLDKKDLDAIDELLARHFTPGLYRDLLKLRSEAEALTLENETLRRELALMRETLKASSGDQVPFS
jgi:mRNA-degrading endonuclease toxin of MazEF toxin-antitoxin module